jgi:alkanesulfonate monooxygenase SsuD/methylene tetrahydromethanopterin reductase-like flavin-dependent oxidoreductase (luciferase family)
MAQLGLVVPDELAGFSIDEMVTIAQRAEQRGYHSIWKGETSGTNSFMVLGAIARETEDIRLGTGIANVFSRSPTLLGMSGATLNALSDGRAILGLGVSSPPIVEEWHGQAYERPLRRAREARLSGRFSTATQWSTTARCSTWGRIRWGSKPRQAKSRYSTRRWASGTAN